MLIEKLGITILAIILFKILFAIINITLFMSQFEFWVVNNLITKNDNEIEKIFYRTMITIKKNGKCFNIVYDIIDNKISEDIDNLYISLTKLEQHLITYKIKKMVNKKYKKYVKNKENIKKDSAKFDAIIFKRKYGIKEL